MNRFQDKSIVVTGAASGFGEAIAKRFAREGGRVLLTDINDEGLARVAQEIMAEGGTCAASACNVAEESEVEAVMSKAVSEFGGINILVNNAGYSHRQRLMWKMSVEDFDAAHQAHPVGAVLGIEIAEEIEDVGGYINAYTSREVTAYYARVLEQDVPLALDMIADIVLNPVFDPREIEVERGVILQEIGQANDTPDDVIFDWLQETAYPNQPLGRTILGPSERVRPSGWLG